MEVNEFQLCPTTTLSEVIVVDVTVNGKKATLLLDSGVSGNFLKEMFLNTQPKSQRGTGEKSPQFNLERSSEKQIKLADGRIIKANKIIKEATFMMKKKRIDDVSFIVLPILNEKYDGILGMPFLQLLNPSMDWKNKSISLPKGINSEIVPQNHRQIHSR